MFIHHFFGGFGGVDGEDEQIHYVDGVCVCVCPITASIFWGLKRFNFPKYFCDGRKIEIKMYEYLVS
jgi:hypothetical protein